VGCAVYVRSGDHLLARGGEVWNVAPDEMRELRAMLDNLVASVDWPVLTVDMPDKLLRNDDGTIGSDLVGDVAMQAAVDAWLGLRDWRFVPDAVRGRLASMFDARGRQVGGSRLPMVRAQTNMPRKR
jgi:hypothetical protein